MPKKSSRRKKRAIFKKPNAGFAGILLLLVIIGIAFLLVGTLSFNKPVQKPITSTVSLTCCDTGDGDACVPQTDEGKTITFKGQQYGLLKTQTEFIEGNLHLKDSGERVGTDPIIVNSSESHIINVANPDIQRVNNACNRPDPVGSPKDFFFKKAPADPYLFMRGPSSTELITEYCASIPDDEIIFVCRENCGPAACSFPVTGSDISCYGTEKSVYDVYYRISDYETNGIPDFVKNCDKSQAANTQPVGPEATIIINNPDAKDNLQLDTFQIVGGSNITPWISPWCKPAIYLYPEKQTQVSVQVDTIGPMTVTIPQYPATGWDVISDPNGIITSHNKQYPYLYYEAQIPDIAITKPDTGFLVSKKAGLETKLTSLLPRLGLNLQETQDFIDYWIKTLPESNYFVVRVIEEKTLDAIAPLSISPKPDTTIRVTLYFEAHKNPVIVKEPNISSKPREGFTVVEWGGLAKLSPGSSFTCFN